MSDKKLSNIYDTLIEEGFNKDVAMLYVIFRSIGTSIKIKPKHFENPGSFTDTVRRKATALTIHYDQKDIDTAFILYAECTYDWDIDAALCGSNLGGKNPIRRTFRELYDKALVGSNLTTE